MSKRIPSILRTTMLQLKSGYLKAEPKTYQHMKRYPPLGNGIPPMTRIDESSVPYTKLYKRAVERNPLYADERVYPAYWAQEPQALTLAKKQYELMQSGLSEEEAYKKSVEYVNVLENEAYLRLKETFRIIKEKDAMLPTIIDKELSPIIASWREKLQQTPYSEMSLADQGEIDYIIQTKLLKWKEVERERRMKDPIFVMQFEKLRQTIFPEILAVDNRKLEKYQKFKEHIYNFFDVSKERLCTYQPFYYQDYYKYFEMLKKQPLLARWNEKDRESLSRWIVDSLAFIEILEKSPTSKLQRYLDLLRAQFFPMVKYPEKVLSFNLPTEDDLRTILFNNDVGYRTVDDKLFIRRYYRLPILLFPEETLSTTLLSDESKAR